MSSAVCTITKGTVSIDLLSSPYCVGSVFPLGNAPRSFSLLSGPHADLPRLAGHAMSDVRTVPFSCEVTGTGGDDLEANLNALYAVLPAPGETATLTIGRSDSAYTGALTVLAVQELSCEYDLARDLSAAAYVTCDLVCEPWVYGVTDTLYSASAITIPCALDLSAMVGEHAAPLDMTFTPAVDLHQLVAGVYPEAKAVSLFVRKAVDLTWSGGAAASDAAGYPDGAGNTVWKTSASTAVYTEIDVSTLLPGSYAVYANAKRDAACSPADILTTYTAPVAITNTTLRRCLLGVVSLPTCGMLAGGASTLRLSLRADGTNYVYCNTVEFLPLSWGVVGWHHATPAGHAHALRWSEHLLYVDSVADLSYVQHGRELLAKGGTLVVTGEGTAEAPTAACETTVTYVPRWEQFIGAYYPHSNTDADKATWRDLSGHGHDATLSGFAWTTTSGWTGSGTAAEPYRLVSPGSPCCGHIGDLSVAEDKTFSYEVWMLESSVPAGNADMVTESQDSSAAGALVFLGTRQTTGCARMTVIDDANSQTYVESSASVCDGALHHIVGTCNGTTMRLYVDGAATGTPTAPPGGTVTLTNGLIGARKRGTSISAYLPAGLCAVRIYSAALTPEQVAEHSAGPQYAGYQTDDLVLDLNAYWARKKP